MTLSFCQYRFTLAVIRPKRGDKAVGCASIHKHLQFLMNSGWVEHPHSVFRRIRSSS